MFIFENTCGSRVLKEAKIKGSVRLKCLSIYGSRTEGSSVT